MRTLLITLATLWLGGCVSLTPYERVVAELPPGSLVAVDDQQVYVETRGAGEPVLLVHGFGGSAYSWRGVMAELESDYLVIAPDLSGFGFTERPHEKTAYTRFAQGELLLGLMDELGLERTHLVGHSYGGAIAAALAVRSPERIETLTLLNAAGPAYPQLRRSVFASLRPLTYAFVRTKSIRHGNIEKSLKRSFTNDELATEELVGEYQRRLAIEGTGRAFWGLTVPMSDPQGMVELRQLTVPTLALWGADDILIPVDFARSEAAEIQDCRFVLIEEAGHMPMEEQPVVVAGALRVLFEQGLDAFAAPCDSEEVDLVPAGASEERGGQTRSGRR